jgi:hypothetical protein
MDQRVLKSDFQIVPVPLMGRDTFTSPLLNVEVSCYRNVFSADDPAKVRLLTWLTSPKYAAVQERVRALPTKVERDDAKIHLPAITPSGLFDGGRTESKLISHSGFVQFDIDHKGNERIMNYTELKQQISHLRNVAYCGLSVSGTGYWGLIPIAYPEKHKEHVAMIEKVFMTYGIMLDPKPKNVASLRVYSHDPDAYFNHSAPPLLYFDEEKREAVKVFNSPIQSSSTDRQATVERWIERVLDSQTDITAGYNTWFEIGCSLANEFGEQGREYYHQVSQFSQVYRQAVTDRQFTYCLRYQYRYTLGTFFYHCKLNGIGCN